MESRRRVRRDANIKIVISIFNSATPVMGQRRIQKELITKMSLNGSGIRDIARVLKISSNTVLTVLTKRNKLVHINPKYVCAKNPIDVKLEMDEMWRFVGNKRQQCWLRHALNHENGEVIAYVLVSRKHEVLWRLLDLLAEASIEIAKVYSDDNYAYHDLLSQTVSETGKRNTQKIERRHLNFKTRLNRLARKTICFSRPFEMHQIMTA